MIWFLASNNASVTLHEVGIFGELVATLATVITLGYLAIQTRANSRRTYRRDFTGRRNIVFQLRRLRLIIQHQLEQYRA
jgi:hypothetical protein